MSIEADEVHTARRSRGSLELDVKVVTDELSVHPERFEGKPTPYRIGKWVAERIEDYKNKPPSTGSVADVLVRWEKIGFVICRERPFGFHAYAPKAFSAGLGGCHSDYNRTRKNLAEKRVR